MGSSDDLTWMGADGVAHFFLLVDPSKSTNTLRTCPTTTTTPSSWLGASLFCFMACLPNSFEIALKDSAAARGASIFACEAHKVYESWPAGRFYPPQGDFSANIEPFMHIWKQVWDDGF